jgi:Cytotoxic translational repressor of toxin-antitoxin stability system
MPDYSIVFAKSARKELESLPNTIINRIFPKIEALGTNPRPAGCRKLKGAGDLWRIRLGDYPVIYSVNDNFVEIDIIALRHRSEAYD